VPSEASTVPVEVKMTTLIPAKVILAGLVIVCGLAVIWFGIWMGLLKFEVIEKGLFNVRKSRLKSLTIYITE
jgi:hypothetical protein